jgi:hypothetical protein
MPVWLWFCLGVLAGFPLGFVLCALFVSGSEAERREAAIQEFLKSAGEPHVFRTL